MKWNEVLRLNPRPRVSVTSVGRGKHKVVTADDYYENPDQVVELAQNLAYVAGGHGSFPGTRAIISLDTKGLVAAVGELWGSRLEPFEPFHPVIFSAIQGGGQLTVAQRQPHIDPGITALVYLNAQDRCAGGTGLYRHRLTGLERIPVAPTAEVAQLALQCGINPESLKSPQGYTAFQDSIIFNPLFAAKGNAYVNDGNDFWELLHLVEMKFNRLVVIDGRMPHSQHLVDGQFRDHSRLTQALYLKP